MCICTSLGFAGLEDALNAILPFLFWALPILHPSSSKTTHRLFKNFVETLNDAVKILMPYSFYSAFTICPSQNRLKLLIVIPFSSFMKLSDTTLQRLSVLENDGKYCFFRRLTFRRTFFPVFRLARRLGRNRIRWLL